MAWDDAPPTRDEIAAVSKSSWDSKPPSADELAAISGGGKSGPELSLTDKALNAGKQFGAATLDNLSGLGAMAGGVIGGVVGGPPGAIAGAGIGGYAGEAGKNLINSYMDPDKAPKSDLEYLAGPALAGAGSAAGEGIGIGAMNVLSKVPKSLGRVGDYILKKAGKIGASVPEEYTAEYLARKGNINARTTPEILDDIGDTYTTRKTAVDRAERDLTRNKENVSRVESDVNNQLMDKKFQSRFDVDNQKDAFNNAAATAQEQLKNNNVLGLRNNILDSIKGLQNKVRAGSSDAYSILQDADGSIKTEPLLNTIDNELEKFKIRGNFATDGDEAAHNAISKLRDRIDQYGDELTLPEAKGILQSLDRETQYNKNAGAFDDIINASKKAIRRDLDQSVKAQVPEYADKMAEVASQSQLLNHASDAFGTEDKALSRLNGLSSAKGRNIDLDILDQLGKHTGNDFVTPAQKYIDTKDLLSSPTGMKSLKESLPEYNALSEAEASRNKLFDPATRRQIQDSLSQGAEHAELAKSKDALAKAEADFEPISPFGSGLQAKMQALTGARNYDAVNKFQALDAATGKNFTQEIKDRAILNSFEKTDTNGSRKTLMGNIAGKTIAGLLGAGVGYHEEGSKGAFIGAGVGFALDKYSGQVLRAVLNARIGTAEATKALGETLGNYAPMLVESAKRGPEALAVTGSMLSKDPKFRKMIGLDGQ